MTKAVARAGGHVTLIFSIHDDDENLDAQGSRGAGFCLRQGAEASATIELPSGGERLDDEPLVDIAVFDYDGSVAPIECLEPYLVLLEELQSSGQFSVSGHNIELNVMLELPRSQGFGMSAAGLLAAARALIRAAEKYKPVEGEGVASTADNPPTEFDLASLVAHRTERRLSSGLGDILALSAGGIELRLEPGAPGEYGRVVGFGAVLSPILVWGKAGIHTGDYIDDATWKVRISTAGEDAVSRLRQGEWNQNKWPELLHESANFAEISGLRGEENRQRLLNKVEEVLTLSGQSEGYVARLCMLGTSVAILPLSLEMSSSESDARCITTQLDALGLNYLRTNI